MKNQNIPNRNSEAIFDICITIGSITNISESWSPKFSFHINFQITESENYPCPYQIVQQDKVLESSIDLRSYRSGEIILSSMQQKVARQVCLFRASLPLRDLQEKQLLCFVQFYVQDQSFGTITLAYNSCLGLCTFLPVYSPSLGITINAKLQTQLLGIRAYKNCLQDTTSLIYKTIDLIFHQKNRLTHKLKTLQNIKQQQKTVWSSSNISPVKSNQFESSQQNDIYKQYVKLKQFRQSRIFRRKSTEQHREAIAKFVNKIKGEYTSNLQLVWQQYLKMSYNQNLSCIQELKNQFIQNFAYQVAHKIVRSNGLLNRNSCLLSVSQVKVNFQGFQLANLSEKKQIKNQEQMNNSFNCRHILVLVHGFGSSSFGMLLIERTIKFLYPHLIILNSRSNENIQSTSNIEMMGRNLAIQIQQFINSFNSNQEFQLSFIGHSLGGLVVRAALTHLQILKFRMNSFISLSTPHLGHIQHSNKLAKFGMIALNTIQQSNVIDELLLKDSSDQRLSYLYSLSTHSGLSWFKSIILYGSQNDGYVSCNSALLKSKNKTKSIYSQMQKNLNQITKDTKLSKFEIKFTHEKKDYKTNLTQLLIGRLSHLAFTSNQSFINFLLLQNYKYFNAPQERLFSEDLY